MTEAIEYSDIGDSLDHMMADLRIAQHHPKAA
jgi:hypothetical protein